MDGRNSRIQSSTATLTVEGDGEGDLRIVTVDCEHASTMVGLIAAAGVVDDVTGVRLGLLRHYAEEGCRCTRQLRRRYNVAVG
ncbi:MAG: hypothetical protein AB7R89_16275 [Dehalococcoidia bacterium]